MKEKGAIIGLGVGMVVISIVYSVYIVIAWQSKTSIFTPYQPPTPPSKFEAFYPLGTVTPMTAQEIKERNEIIALSRNANF